MCPQLQEPVDGFLRITGLAVGAETVYFCDSGFQRNGLLRRECLPTGNWSGSETVCDRELHHGRALTELPQSYIGLKNLKSYGNVNFTRIGRNFWYMKKFLFWIYEKSFILFECPIARLDDPKNPTLSSALPGTVSCGRLMDPQQGMVAHDDTTPGSMATYSCTLGYVLVGGARERRCQNDGTWDGSEPTCNGTLQLFINNFSTSNKHEHFSVYFNSFSTPVSF